MSQGNKPRSDTASRIYSKSPKLPEIIVHEADVVADNVDVLGANVHFHVLGARVRRQNNSNFNLGGGLTP